MHPIRHESSAHRRSRTLSIGNSSIFNIFIIDIIIIIVFIILNIIIIIVFTIINEYFNGTHARIYHLPLVQAHPQVWTYEEPLASRPQTANSPSARGGGTPRSTGGFHPENPQLRGGPLNLALPRGSSRHDRLADRGAYRSRHGNPDEHQTQHYIQHLSFRVSRPENAVLYRTAKTDR